MCTEKKNTRLPVISKDVNKTQTIHLKFSISNCSSYCANTLRLGYKPTKFI